MKWELKTRKVELKNKFFTIFEDDVNLPSGDSYKYYHSESPDGVVVVPIKIKKDNIYFVMVEQYRYPVGRKILEFPKGAIEAGETPESAALRELEEETGYKSNQIKFVYQLEVSPSRTNNKAFVYLAVVEDEPGQTDLGRGEEASELVVKEFSSDVIYKMITDNEITDSVSVSALSVVMLQSPKAKDYLGSTVVEERENAA